MRNQKKWLEKENTCKNSNFYWSCTWWRMIYINSSHFRVCLLFYKRYFFQRQFKLWWKLIFFLTYIKQHFSSVLLSSTRAYACLALLFMLLKWLRGACFDHFLAGIKVRLHGANKQWWFLSIFSVSAQETKRTFL